MPSFHLAAPDWARFRRRLMRLATPLTLAGLLGACTTENVKEDQLAELVAHDSQLSVLYAQSIIILAVDGHNFGPKYKSVWVQPGYHEARIAYIDCALPVLVVTCLRSARELTVPFEAEAGKRYFFRKANSVWIEEERNAPTRGLDQ
ncbi:MAG: hypothetical protein AAF493_13240 [Pseudomonadota bacterium]